MGKFAEQQIAQQEAKEMRKVRREKLAGYFYDLSKLSFTGLVISVVIQLVTDITNPWLWGTEIIGIVLTCLLARLANKILK